MKRAWLKFYRWDSVEALNQALCAGKSAMHKPTSDGYEPTRQMWIENHTKECDLFEALQLCRNAHRGAPFVNFNGNTFAAIARQAVGEILRTLPAPEAAAFRSQAGHYVAGVLDGDSLAQTLRGLGLIE